MAFTLIGRIIAVDQQQTVASKNDASKTFQRRQVYLDCSRYDSITGEQLSENKPLLEFGGKGLEQLENLIKGGLKKGDLVSVKFAVQGTPYKDKDGKMKNFTGIRPYAIERYIPRSQQGQQQQTQPATAQAPAPQTAVPAAQPALDAPFPQGQANDLPF
jgi:hypothetical protein